MIWSQADLIGWTASALMVATFSCSETQRMRPLAVLTNVAFIGYGAVAWLPPVLVLHVLLLPINLWRWAECMGAREFLVSRFDALPTIRRRAFAAHTHPAAGANREPDVPSCRSTLTRPLP